MHNYAATDNIISFTSTHGMSTEKMNSLVVILISKTSDHDSVTMLFIVILGHVGLGTALCISILISIMCGVIIVQCYMIRSLKSKRQM